MRKKGQSSVKFTGKSAFLPDEIMLSLLVSQVKPSVAQACGHDWSDAHLKGSGRTRHFGHGRGLEFESPRACHFLSFTYAQLPSPLVPLEREKFTLAQSQHTAMRTRVRSRNSHARTRGWQLLNFSNRQYCSGIFCRCALWRTKFRWDYILRQRPAG
jgi:hypothetical protein